MKSIKVLCTALVCASALTACQQNAAFVPAAVPAPAFVQAQSARAVYHVVPASGAWQVKASRNPVALSTHRTKAEAIEAGRAMAKSHELGQLIIHRADGTFEKEYTYGNDPHNILG